MNQTEIDEKARTIIQSRIQKGMIGPGSDTWGLPDDDEIIANDYPLIRYFSGIIFPDKTNSRTEHEAEVSEAESQAIPEADENDKSTNVEDLEEEITRKKLVNSPKAGIDELKIGHNNFFPTNIGLSVALREDVKEIQVVFSFGLYTQLKNQKEIRIPISEEGYRSFFYEKIVYQLPFKDALKYENGLMFIDRELKGHKGGRGQERSGEYRQFDEFRKRDNLIDSPAYTWITSLEKLLGRVWKRKGFKQNLTIPVKSTDKIQIIELAENVNEKTKLGYNVKVVSNKNANYLKVQLVNCSDKHQSNRFSNKSEPLNEKSVFQTSLRIQSDGIISYKNNSICTYFTDEEIRDTEAEEIEFIYRNVKNYGVGHNCSVKWSADHKMVETTFLPEQNIKDVINQFRDNSLDPCLDIRNLSNWGLPQDKIILNLKEFVSSYRDWIKEQADERAKLAKNEAEIAQKLIDRQLETFNRLNENLELLNDARVFKAFRLANTAMLIQLIVSNDSAFGKTEKEISELDTHVQFGNIEFFKNYNAKDRLGFIPKYRPFQLAFVILSLEEIVKPESRKKRNIVDLIWFPTGGGKTEAYLAVSAFTIAYRRITNEVGFEGTSVIMRYTLRLLTAQQFERASRLITALEFLRNQTEFKGDLKSEPITIGLWVGQASTPNTIHAANDLLDGEKYGMEAEAQKGENGDPHKYNEFQISSCPWCGTKIISKEKNLQGKEVWKYGFLKRKSDFILRCLNTKCFFHTRLPIQVVDEVLYKSPPTLLFGTVDKFAMLAWKEEAYNFFKSNTTEGLPPDLIIQDELHLLNGPLGSITGLYESVIELLCTKNGIGPKIISSTATTRNTDLQIQRLYGNRKVNIFPPSGINFNDSYFAREDEKASKRRYIGFMPTGKTAIDTQLQLLAHLLLARLEVFRNSETKERTDLYWTIVSYYNSLKDVGKIYNKVGDEVSNFTSTLQYRLAHLFQPSDSFNYYGISSRTEELTSRVESAKIKSVLKEIEKSFSESKIETSEKGNKYLADVVDLVLATNMFSVGIDISRLNLMLINGIPKNIAEYIQASSRVGRTTKGLVITQFDPNRAREKSYFEHFINFHQAFYKCVEPLSITPFTESTIDKMLTTALVSYVRNKIPFMSKDDAAKSFKKEQVKEFRDFVAERFAGDSKLLNYFDNKLSELLNDWQERATIGSKLTYEALLKKPTSKLDGVVDWATMQSMREIDTDTFVEIKSVY
jgi:hypothetical protein